MGLRFPVIETEETAKSESETMEELGQEYGELRSESIIRWNHHNNPDVSHLAAH